MNNHSSGHAVGPNTPNIVTTPNGVHDHSTHEPTINGDLNHTKSAPPASPAAYSPATPISTIAIPDIKIDIDYEEQESDARHEPMPIKVIEPIHKTGVTIPQTETPMDSFPTPTHPPNGISSQSPEPEKYIEDTKMVGTTPTLSPNGVNGSPHEDIVMCDAETETPARTSDLHTDSLIAMISPNGASTVRPASTDRPYRDDDEDDGPPPAKRARMHSDARSATPPPASAIASTASTPAPLASFTSTLTAAQFKFSQSTIRSLKKLKDASPFLRPVDYVALNVPHYPSIIKMPMDFSTIERKLVSSNPNKVDINSSNPRYHNADEFINDVRLIFQNCITFNGPDHAITLMGKRVEQVFDKQIKQMPAALEIKPSVVKKAATPPPPPPPPVTLKKPTVAARRMSTSVPVIRRSETEAVGRPKREIHPPPPKDLAYADAPKKHRKGKGSKDDGTTEQLRFCSKLLTDLNRKQYYQIASPFYEPVDWVKLDLPSYPKMIKRPMDLMTIRKKLDGHQYPTAQKFFDDFKLMIRNCFVFNPAGTPVNQAGIELQRVFDDRWKQLPPLRDVMSDEEEEEEEEDSEDDRQRTIAMMESQIETMRGNIEALKGTKVPKEKKKKEKRDKPPVASSSKATGKQAKALSKKKSKKSVVDNDVLTFEQKRDLSESIAKLDETKLEKVIQIIHDGVPEIRDSTEEIELEIDLLPASVLTKLYNFVIRPMRAPATKRVRQGKGTGTGGLKRKSMDEDKEAEKIRLLEERMALFDHKANGGAPIATRQDDSDHSSDSSSNSDSSGSDSE